MILRPDGGAKVTALLGLFAAGLVAHSAAIAGNEDSAFRVRDDIHLAQFAASFQGQGQSSIIARSPDGRYVAFVIERGDLEANAIKDELYVFPANKLPLPRPSHLERTRQPLALVSAFTPKGEADAIADVKWLDNSSGLAFLMRTPSGIRQLTVADVKRRSIQALSRNDQDVTSFDERGGVFVYSVPADSATSAGNGEVHPLVTVATGRMSGLLLFPRDAEISPNLSRPNELWIVDNKRLPRRIMNASTGQPIRIRRAQWSAQKFWLSPDAETLLALQPVHTVPRRWEQLTMSAYPGETGITPGRQDLSTPMPGDLVEEFVTISLRNGRVEPLLGTPVGLRANYFSSDVSGGWSKDGKRVVLANTFVPSSLSGSPSDPKTPCIAVVDMISSTVSCVLRLPSDPQQLAVSMGIHRIVGVSFVGGAAKRLRLDVIPTMAGRTEDNQIVPLFYAEDLSGTWRPIRRGNAQPTYEEKTKVHFEVQQSLDQPPYLAARSGASHEEIVIFDPNACLRGRSLGSTHVMRWADRRGATWVGGLMLPPGYSPGRRYPLVIQTHGFSESRYLSSGAFSSAMAARELANVGIAVLQIGAPNNGYETVETPYEGEQQVDGYEAAISELAAEGIIDPQRIGITGFSRTVYPVLIGLTSERLKFAAAILADGVQFDYFNYLLNVDAPGANGEAKAVIGSAPFGKGLSNWINRSPEFRFDKVRTPVRVEAYGNFSLLTMWPAYSALRIQGKPVDLIEINSGEHVQTSPGARLASQGGAVDWYRFWLQGYEDPDPAKRDKYHRWEGLCDMQRTEIPTRPALCVATRPH